jgi:hypothetical protein
VPHSIDHDNRDLSAWEEWARWPNIRSAASSGAGFAALSMAIGAIVVSLQRVRAHESTPARVVVASLLIEAVSIAFGALIGGGVALFIRGIRRPYLARKRRELTA